MSPSFTDINYALRPAKNVERKMLCEAFRRLGPFCPIEQFKYVGFGSAYFSDFSLFHKVLNLSSMDSIEREAAYENRIRFNQPYQCITLHFNDSGNVLPNLPWETAPHLVWLDYDGELNLDVLADIKTVVTNAISASVLVVSVNAHPGKNDPDWRHQRLIDLVGDDKIPPGFVVTDLDGWGTARVFRRIIHNEIQENIQLRNGGVDEPDQMLYKQLFNFHYADGANMLTVGGILHSANQQESFDRCEFHRLRFYRDTDQEYRIKVPKLTFREIRELDRKLPHTVDLPELEGLSHDLIEEYAEIYRYFPAFSEVDV